MDINDEQLITDYFSGDDDAFAAIVNRYLKPVYNFIYRLVGNAQDAEDITQETFVKVWTKLKKYRRGESFKAWLFAVARNSAMDFLRKKKSPVLSDFEDNNGRNVIAETLADTEPLPDEIAALAEDKDSLNKLLAGLSALQREVIVLHYGESLTFNEIGNILGKPLQTVKSWHWRALQALKKAAAAPKSKNTP